MYVARSFTTRMIEFGLGYLSILISIFNLAAREDIDSRNSVEIFRVKISLP